MGKKTTSASPAIPQYVLKGFRRLHRQEGEHDTSDFGYNNLAAIHPVEGFELYSQAADSNLPSLGPLKSAFLSHKHYHYRPCGYATGPGTF